MNKQQSYYCPINHSEEGRKGNIDLTHNITIKSCEHAVFMRKIII